MAARMESFSFTAQLATFAGASLFLASSCASGQSKTTGSIPVVPVTVRTDADAAQASPTGSSDPDAASNASLAPLPPPDTPAEAPPAPAAPRVLLADELPYFPVRLRAHDVPPEHHHARHPERAGHASHADERGESTSRRPYHPAPGIVVEVVDAQGGLSAADLQRLARSNGYWPFRQCYEEGLRKDQRLAGKVTLELLVTPAGAVDRSTVTTATVHDEIVAACVAREARHLGLSAVDAPTTAKIDVTLAVGDEPVQTAKPLPTAATLRDALREPWDAVRKCYAGELGGHPDAGGRLELTFHVKRDGEILEVSEGDTRFGDVQVTRCVLGIYRTTKLPPLHLLHDGHFVYAIHFESKPEETAAP
jgi:hypothetical protein